MAAGSHRPLRWTRELAAFGAAYVLYALARWVFIADYGEALANAHAIVSLQRELGLTWEAEAQQSLGRGLLLTWLNHVYLASEFLVLPAVLVWLFRRRPAAYRRLRSALIVAWVAAVPVFALLPVAPPRLAQIGILDTVSSGSLPLQSRVVTPFYNPYAAMPSLHCGFALALALGVLAARPRPRVAALALTWPAQVALATVVTGNHYVLDVVAGGMVAVLAWVAAPRLAELPARARRGFHLRLPARRVRALGAWRHRGPAPTLDRRPLGPSRR